MLEYYLEKTLYGLNDTVIIYLALNANYLEM